MKRIGIVILLIFLFSCATTRPDINRKNSIHKIKNIYNEIEKSLSFEDNSTEFEKSFPESKLILNSTVLFEKINRKTFITDNLIDFALGDNEIILLKNNSIELINNKCNGFIFDTKNFAPDKIKYSNGLVALIGKEKIDIFTLTDCGKIYTLRRKWKYFLFNKDFYFFSNGNNFEIYKYGNNLPVMRGKFYNTFKAGYLNGETLKILDKKGQILTFSLNRFNIDNVTRTGYKVKKGAVFKNNVVILTENKNIILNGKIIGKHVGNTIFSKNSADVFVNHCFQIMNKKLTIPVKNNISSFAVKDNLIFFQESKNLFALNEKKRYVKSIRFKSPSFHCKCDNNSLIFYDINGKKKIIPLKNTNCTKCKYYNGAFVNENKKTIYTFSRKIKKENGYTMYKRTLNNKIFYYFEKY